MKQSEDYLRDRFEHWLPRDELRRTIADLKDERLRLETRIAWLEGREIALDFHLEEERRQNERLRGEIDRLSEVLGTIHRLRLWRLYTVFLKARAWVRGLPLFRRLFNVDPA
jgi:hypothetical protein